MKSTSLTQWVISFILVVSLFILSPNFSLQALLICAIIRLASKLIYNYDIFFCFQFHNLFISKYEKIKVMIFCFTLWFLRLLLFCDSRCPIKNAGMTYMFISFLSGNIIVLYLLHIYQPVRKVAEKTSFHSFYKMREMNKIINLN